MLLYFSSRSLPYSYCNISTCCLDFLLQWKIICTAKKKMFLSWSCQQCERFQKLLLFRKSSPEILFFQTLNAQVWIKIHGKLYFGTDFAQTWKFAWLDCSFSLKLIINQLIIYYLIHLFVVFNRQYVSVVNSQNLFHSSSLYIMFLPLHCGMLIFCCETPAMMLEGF